jgi:hypothetical protein
MGATVKTIRTPFLEVLYSVVPVSNSAWRGRGGKTGRVARRQAQLRSARAAWPGGRLGSLGLAARPEQAIGLGLVSRLAITDPCLEDR